MTATITAPVVGVQLAAYVPELVRSCLLQPPPPPPPADDDFPGPQPPGSDPDTYPPVTIVDTSPDRMIGCIIRAASNPQVRINSLFPDAIAGDGVIERSTLDIWVFDGVLWNNVGPNPGPTIVDAPVIPPWTVTVLLEGTVRSELSVTSFNYALEQLTELEPLTVRSGLSVTNVLPAIGIGIEAMVPQVSTGAAVQVPAADVGVAAPAVGVVSGGGVTTAAAQLVLDALAVSVSSGGSVAVPETAISFSAVVPFRVGPPVPATEVLVPAVDVTVGAAAPDVAGGASVDVGVVDQAISGLIPGVAGGGSVAAPVSAITFAAAVPSLPESDANFSSVELLLHCDGTNGSTTFTDSSSNGLTMTVNGSAKLSTAVSRFGTASADFNSGTNANLSYAGNLLDVQSNQDFTVEFWFYPTASSTAYSTTSSYSIVESSGGVDWSLHFGTSGGNRVLGFVTAYSFTRIMHQTTVSLNTWVHVAVVRASNVVALYLDGIKSTSTYTVSSAYDNSSFFSFGPRQGGASNKLYMDDIRMTIGVARYTSDFTPPTAPFPDM